ncbi:MAG: hypothetical protein ABIQ39_16890 [Ilumatobacteraceae bacterium]
MQTTFVVICYVATFGGVGTLVALMLRRARSIAANLPAEDLPWT